DRASKTGKKLSPHGLRKAACVRLAHAGCSTKEIAAISGHKSLHEIERYTRDAEQARLARSAMARLREEDKKYVVSRLPCAQAILWRSLMNGIPSFDPKERARHARGSRECKANIGVSYLENGGVLPARKCRWNGHQSRAGANQNGLSRSLISQNF